MTRFGRSATTESGPLGLDRRLAVTTAAVLWAIVLVVVFAILA